MMTRQRWSAAAVCVTAFVACLSLLGFTEALPGQDKQPAKTEQPAVKCPDPEAMKAKSVEAADKFLEAARMHYKAIAKDDAEYYRLIAGLTGFLAHQRMQGAWPPDGPLPVFSGVPQAPYQSAVTPIPAETPAPPLSPFTTAQPTTTRGTVPRGVTVRSGTVISSQRKGPSLRNLIESSANFQAQQRSLIQRRGQTNPRIVNGDKADPGEFPHCCALGRYFGSGFQFSSCCTGTLIFSNVVVTAAHCPDLGCSPTHVYFGEDATRPIASRVYGVSRVVPVAGFPYNSSTSENDIVLLILDRAVSGVTPCPIATTAEFNARTDVTIAGFGITKAGRDDTGVLYTADVTRISGSQFDSAIHRGKEFVAAGRADSCNGDSGGPAYYRTGTRTYLLAGVVSRGDADCQLGGIYVRADFYRDAIFRTVRDLNLSVDVPGSGTTPDCPSQGRTSDIAERTEYWLQKYPELRDVLRRSYRD